jgi:MFS family permease
MINRWTILSVLFLARVSMAFQFQAVAALSPVLAETMRLSLAQIGVLIGLYLAPGLVVAVPGGALAARVGEKRLIAAAMVAMALGALLAAAGPIMTLPGTVLAPAMRSYGVGVFWTVYYVVMMLAPPVAGYVAERAGSVGAALMTGVVFCGVSIAALWLFRGLARPSGRAA